MAGLVPAIHVSADRVRDPPVSQVNKGLNSFFNLNGVDDRDKPGHDEFIGAETILLTTSAISSNFTNK
jgi:hypothetical protein